MLSNSPLQKNFFTLKPSLCNVLPCISILVNNNILRGNDKGLKKKEIYCNSTRLQYPAELYLSPHDQKALNEIAETFWSFSII